MSSADLTAASLPHPEGARVGIRLFARRDTAALAVLVGIGIGIPLWLAAAAGTIGIPNNDDWVYMRGASSLFATGRIDMPGHTAAAVGQLLLVQPLLWLSGGQPWAFTAFGLVMSLIGVVATYLLARRFVGLGSAVLVALLVVAFPGFARQTATFMTDGPGYALGTLCLLLGVRWLQGDGGRLTLAASLGVGLLAVGVREFAIAAPMAILIAAWVRNRADERIMLAVASAAFAAGVVSVLLIADSIPGRSLAGAWLGLSVPVLLMPAFLTLTAVLLPAAALSIGRRMATVSPAHVIAAAVVFLVVTVPQPGYVFIGNFWDPSGAGTDSWLNGTRNEVIPGPVWLLSEQLALFAAILVGALAFAWAQRHLARVGSLSEAWAAAVRIVRGNEGALLVFLVLCAGELAVFGSMNLLFDRYLYPMVPAAAILLLSGLGEPARPGRSPAFAHAALAWLAVSAFLIAANSFAYDAARYRAGASTVALGYAAATVDAGYEWVGSHASEAPAPGASDHGLMWYDKLMPSRPCAVLSNSPLDKPGYTLIREDPSAYRQYLFFGPEEPFYLYGSTASGCPVAPLAAAGRTAP